MRQTVYMQSEKIVTLTRAADIDLEPIWATLLAKALEGKNVKDLLLNVGSGGGAPAAGAVPAAVAAGGAPAEAPKEEEKKPEKEEESDDDMVCFNYSIFTCPHPGIERALVCSINLCMLYYTFIRLSSCHAFNPCYGCENGLCFVIYMRRNWSCWNSTALRFTEHYKHSVVCIILLRVV
jgi:large subunit ribosomal protein LP1